MLRKPTGGSSGWSLVTEGGFQKPRTDSSRPPAQHLSSQSGHWKEVNASGNHMNRKADPFLVEPLDEDPVLANTSKKPAKPCRDFRSTEMMR